jgi:integrase
VAFALFTGARRNELQAQRWEWIDWDRKLVRLYTSKRQRGESRGKLRRRVMRAIPLWPTLESVLLRLWITHGRPAAGLVFPRIRAATRERIHVPTFERGGRADKAIKQILRTRGVLTGGEQGDPLRFLGQPGYQVSWREFRVTYCATRLQTVEPVAGKTGEWTPVARRTVELEMGHASEDMVNEVYGRVVEGPQVRLPTVDYPIQFFERYAAEEQRWHIRLA